MKSLKMRETPVATTLPFLRSNRKYRNTREVVGAPENSERTSENFAIKNICAR